MKKYYLFVIKNEYYKIYRKTPVMLYKTLENLYMLERYDFSYGISLYNQLCQPFSVKLLTNYITNKYKCYQASPKILQIKSLVEKTFIQIGYSAVIIFTNAEYPEILKVFNTYNRKIFVCDFEHQKCFWLNHQVSKNSKF